jgi:hypothetical protein
MKKTSLCMVIFATLLLTACVIAPSHRGEGGVVIAPALPAVVELEFPDALYFYSDYYYHYRDNDWYYSHSKNGPWNNLPRDRHPREIRYKNRGGNDDRDRDRDKDRGRGDDEQRGHEHHDHD